MTTTGIDLPTIVENTKDFNIFSYRNFYNGGGVAIGDINNDGFQMFFLPPTWGPINYISIKGFEV